MTNINLFDLACKSFWAMEQTAYESMLAFLDVMIERGCSSPAITEQLAKSMHADYEKYVANGKFVPFAFEKYSDADLPGAIDATYRKNVAIIPISGPIVPRASMMTLSGARSVSSLMKDFTTAFENSAIDTIIQVVDSPGGNVVGISELSNAIYDQAKTSGKKVLTYVTGNMASAALWLGTSSQKVYGADTSLHGSIGVVSGFVDTSKADERRGIQKVEIVSSQSPKKRLSPMSNEGQAHAQEMVNQLADIFISTVARNRNVSSQTVIDTFGQGGMFVAKQAQEVGLIDGITSLEKLIDENIFSSYTGGYTMPFSVAEVKEKSSETYNAIIEEGKVIGRKEALLSSEENISSARKEGAFAEQNRIKAIEALKFPGAEKVIAENKYNMEMTDEKVAVLIIKGQNNAKEDYAKNFAADNDVLTKQLEGLGASQTNNLGHELSFEDEAAIASMVEGASAKANANKNPFEAK